MICTIVRRAILRVVDHASLQAHAKYYGRANLELVETIEIEKPLTASQLHRLPGWLREKMEAAC